MIKLKADGIRTEIDFESSQFAIIESVNAILHICDKLAAEKDMSITDMIALTYSAVSSRAQDFKCMIEIRQECESYAKD